MILDLLKKRCSVRNFADLSIPDHIIKDILEAGRLSPSGGNEQPWKFGVITDKQLIESISKAAYNQTWISTAPLLIVLCCTIVSDNRGAREIQKRRFPKWEKSINEMDKKLYSYLNTEEHQTKIPAAHMCLQALEQGIYSTWISCFDVLKVTSILCLPDLCVPSEIIAFGYPSGDLLPREKRDIEEIVFYNNYT